jgi:WD40 repeat protein/serine/threonine protein kinase
MPEPPSGPLPPEPDLPGNLQRGELAALIRADQQTRWLRGEHVLVEEYLRQHPALLAGPEDVVDLVYHEMVLRQQNGEPIDLDDYLRRFPAHAEQIRRQWAFHQALQSRSLLDADWLPETPPGEPDQTEKQPPDGAAALGNTVTLITPPPADTPAGTLSFSGAPVPPPAPPPPAGARTDLIAGYQILAELGRGSMGVVYKAVQVRLKRVVALKMILAGSHAGGQELARFRTEAEAVARLQHPNIIQVFEIGEHASGTAPPCPYMALEFCGGRSLADLLDGTPLPPEHAAELVETLARAIHHAHLNGIVHRDLKPSNILLAYPSPPQPPSPTKGRGGSKTASLPLSPLWERGPGGEGFVPKITDFGLAKKLDEAAGPTVSGAILGTPSYMAPEQAGNNARGVGAGTDIYALGAILYELLTGRPPFRAPTSLETVWQLLTADPLPVRYLQPKCPADLETICLKCLQKERKKRYATAEELADDLRRYSNGEPIMAKAVGPFERGVKWLRRRPALTAVLVVSLLALVGLAAGGVWFTRKLQVEHTAALKERERAEQEKDRAEGQRLLAEDGRREARSHLYVARMTLAQNAWRDAEVGKLLGLLEAALPMPEQEDLRGFEWYYLWHLCHADLRTLRQPVGPVTALALSSDGKRLAVGGVDGIIHVHAAGSGKELFTLGRPQAPVTSLAFSADGKLLACGSEDRTIKVWDAAAASGGGARQPRQLLRGHDGPVVAVAFAPGSSTRLASASDDATARVWDVDREAPVQTLRGHTRPVRGLGWSPDGQRLATAGADDTARVWDAQTGKELFPLHGHGWIVNAVAFSPDDRRLATASADGSVRVWEADGGRPLATLGGHSREVTGVLWSPDGRHLASCSADHTVWLWEAPAERAREPVVLVFKGHTREVTDLAFTPDGKQLLSASADGSVKFWDTQTDPEALTLTEFPGMVFAVALSPDGEQLACGGEDQTVRLWDLRTRKQTRVLRGLPNWVTGVAFSADGTRLAAGSGGFDEMGRPLPGAVRVWDLATGQPVFTRADGDSCGGVAFSPDGSHLVTGGREVHVWDVPTGKRSLTLPGHGDRVNGVAWSHDGKRLATAGQDRTVRVWDAATGALVDTLTGHAQRVFSVAFSPDGRRLASAGGEPGNPGELRVWELDTGRPPLSLRGHTNWVAGVCFSPDGRRLASAGADPAVRLWDLATGQEVLTLRGNTSVAFSRDGQKLAGASGGGFGPRGQKLPGEAKVWTAPRPPGP